MYVLLFPFFLFLKTDNNDSGMPSIEMFCTILPCLSCSFSNVPLEMRWIRTYVPELHQCPRRIRTHEKHQML